MIPIKKQPKPRSFDSSVSSPGNAWLASHPDYPTASMPQLWRNILQDLWSAYGGICAYYCFYIEIEADGSATVDHFLPKSKFPHLAYDWNNYRLSCLTANRNKGSNTVIDPFSLKPDTFRIHVLDGSVYPNPRLPPNVKTKCGNTIKTLKLNSEGCNRRRADEISNYLQGDISLSWLQKYSPFVATEIQRQGLVPIVSNTKNTIRLILQ